jgi:hypothetical protein
MAATGRAARAIRAASKNVVAQAAEAALRSVTGKPAAGPPGAPAPSAPAYDEPTRPKPPLPAKPDQAGPDRRTPTGAETGETPAQIAQQGPFLTTSQGPGSVTPTIPSRPAHADLFCSRTITFARRSRTSTTSASPSEPFTRAVPELTGSSSATATPSP